MSQSAEIIRKACLQLEDCKLDAIPDKQISNYSNRLRESCRRYSERNSTKPVKNEINLSNAKRHKKFVLAKLELKRLQEHSKKYLSQFGNHYELSKSFNEYKSKKITFHVNENLNTNHNKEPITILKKTVDKSDRHNKSVKFSPEPLFWDCALDGDLESLRRISLNISDFDVNNFSGVTALHNAASSGSLLCVQYLVELGCDVNLIDDCGWSSLHYAAFYGNTNICDFLIKNGANVFLQTFDQNLTPYDVCKDSGPNKACLKLLMDAEKEVGSARNGVVYASHNYSKHHSDELSFQKGDGLKIMRRGDEKEKCWWWACNSFGHQGYVPFSLLTVYHTRK